MNHVRNLLLYCLLSASVAFSKAPLYDVHEIEPLPNHTTNIAYGIGPGGLTVGSSSTAAGPTQAWRKSAAFPFEEPLGTLGGAWSEAFGINHINNAVGWSQTGAGPARAFKKIPNNPIQDLGTLPGDSSSKAYRINNTEDIVGWSSNAAGRKRAFFKFGAAPLSDLGTLGGNESIAYSINNRVDIVGMAQNAAGNSHAFRKLFNQAMEDLGTLGGASSEAYGINEHRDVVGWATNNAGQYLAFYKAHNQALVNIGLLPGREASFANDINSNREVVGVSHNLIPGFDMIIDQRPFIWAPNRPLRDLNDLIPAGTGWELKEALAINGSGKIAGWGILNNDIRAFVLIPRRQAGAGFRVAPAAQFGEISFVLLAENGATLPVSVPEISPEDSLVTLAEKIQIAVTSSENKGWQAWYWSEDSDSDDQPDAYYVRFEYCDEEENCFGITQIDSLLDTSYSHTVPFFFK